MRVVYLAHPVAGDVPGNLARAKRWLRWVEERHSVAVCAPWITACEVWDDADPEQREAGMQRNFAVLARCHEIWLVGGRISPGMARERDFAELLEIPAHDLTHLGEEP